MRSHRTVSRLGIVGFGAFGRLIAEHLGGRFDILAFDRAGPPSAAPAGARFAGLAEVATCPIVILAVPVDAIAEACRAVAPHLQPGALVLDVGSVKLGPARAMLAHLPDAVEILATHPLFGPQSARDGLAGLKIALCPLRGTRAPRVAAFLRRALGLDVIVTTPEAHDREAALSQGLTHLVAKVLAGMEPLPNRVTTRSFDLLREAVGMVRHDPPEIFEAVTRGNPFAGDMRRLFVELAQGLDRELGPESVAAR
ncbi:hypothetical protein GCM10011390_45250 [Aureimonas endophytica]|uniref:Prephenate/arogenate dehydrogenase domain-containing protein n=1 Tax=Aureimonas endophytica TaxID=2027858 RepID=A0A917A0A3_9HYPH|nr:prephenate dehydrogenase [Aureimonas endophytica]GGE20910.1 hypothetical protein GCM10011390_45250 [Aureimonas endophytica]